MLYSFGTLIPVVTILVLESVRAFTHIPETFPTSSRSFLRWKVPPRVQIIYVFVAIFAFGAASSQLITDIAKYTIGRLRPHFFDLCEPQNLEKLCTTKYTYVEKFECGSNATRHQLKEVRLSFMSGHSSFSAYTMLYAVVSACLWSSAYYIRMIITTDSFCLTRWFESG